MQHAADLHGQFRNQLKAFRRELPGLDRGEVESLHRTRIASRRLRELLPLLDVPDETRKRLIRRLRRVTRLLGKVRELDVLARLIDTLKQDGRYASALDRVSEEVARSQSAARERLAAKLPAAKLERLAGRLKRAARTCKADSSEVRSAPPAKQVRQWALEARQARRAEDLRLAIASAGTLYSPEPLHGVRVAIKKFRYAVELAALDRRRLKVAVATLESAQDQLGRLHDLEVFLAWARATQALLDAPSLTEWKELGALARAIEDDCREEHARYLRQRVLLLAIADRVAGRKPATLETKGRKAAG